MYYPGGDDDETMAWPISRRRSTTWMGLSPARVWPDSTSFEEGTISSAGEGISPSESYFLPPDGFIDEQTMDTLPFGAIGPPRHLPPTHASGRRRRGWGKFSLCSLT